MIPNESLINILRSKRYSYKGQSDRMVIYKRPGSTTRILIRRNVDHSEEYARVILRQAGFSQDEVDRAIAEALG